MRLSILALLLVIPMGVGAAACTPRASPREVPGTYVLARGPAIDTLIVHADGRWTRRLTVEGRAIRSDTGSWSVEKVTGENRIVFENLDPEPPTDGSTRSGMWAVAAERPLFGQTRLPVSYDLDIAFIRVSGQQ